MYGTTLWEYVWRKRWYTDTRVLRSTKKRIRVSHSSHTVKSEWLYTRVNMQNTVLICVLCKHSHETTNQTHWPDFVQCVWHFDLGQCAYASFWHFALGSDGSATAFRGSAVYFLQLCRSRHPSIALALAFE